MEHCDCCGGNKRLTSTPTSKVPQLWRTASCPNPFASPPPPRQQVLAPARTYSQPINFDTTSVEEGVRKFIAGNSLPVPTSSPKKRSPVEMIKKEEEDKDGSTKKQGEGEGEDQDDGQGVLYTVSFRCNCGAPHKFTFRKG